MGNNYVVLTEFRLIFGVKTNDKQTNPMRA